MLNSKPAKIVMGKNTFYIQRYSPFYALRVLGDLQKVLLPVLTDAGAGFASGAAGNWDKDVKSLEVLFPAAAGGLLSIADHLDGKQLEALARLLLDPDYVAVAAGRAQAVRLEEDLITEIFDGNVADLFYLMAQVIRVNYLDFSRSCSIPAGVRTALQDMAAAFRGLTRKSSDEEPTSTGA